MANSNQSRHKLVPKLNLDPSLSWLIALLVALVFAVLAWPLFTGKLFTYDDLVNMNLPMRYAYWKSIANGDNFLWSPLFDCGVYLHGESEVGMFHPVHLLLYTALPLGVAFNIEFLCSYIGLFFGYLCNAPSF